jgi:hypothetical protein
VAGREARQYRAGISLIVRILDVRWMRNKCDLNIRYLAVIILLDNYRMDRYESW